MKNKLILLSLIAISVTLTGCRGWMSEKPPVHPNINLDNQARFNPQTLPLTPPENTLTWKAVDTSKPDVSLELLKRGQERYNIYCSVCHDKTGSGKGIVIERGLVPPPDLSSIRILNVTDEYLYGVISNGVRSMPGYKKQIPPVDRWAIVTYIRALQKTKTTLIEDLPKSERNKL